MRKRFVVALMAALMAAGTVTAVAAGTTTSVACTITDNTLSCPLPAPPAPVTVTATQSVTVMVTASSAVPTTTAAPTTTSTAPTTAASTTTAPPPTATWPDATNTGVPTGVTLTNWTGSGACFITANNTVIDGKTFNCDVVINAQNITIKNSKINGIVIVEDVENSGNPAAGAWSATILDSEVNAPQVQRPAISGTVTVKRANVHGGATSIQCDELSAGCTVEDSWVHDQKMPAGADWHLDGFLSNGGKNFTIRHNRIGCTAPNGCTGAINLIPNFATISNVVIENNLLTANPNASYCTYGGDKSQAPYPHADHVIYRNNVFERGSNNQCGTWGPVTSFNSAGVGNQWVGNKYTDGAVVNPAN